MIIDRSRSPSGCTRAVREKQPFVRLTLSYGLAARFPDQPRIADQLCWHSAPCVGSVLLMAPTRLFDLRSQVNLVGETVRDDGEQH